MSSNLEFRENSGTMNSLWENNEDSEKIMNIAALFSSKVKFLCFVDRAATVVAFSKNL